MGKQYFLVPRGAQQEERRCNLSISHGNMGSFSEMQPHNYACCDECLGLEQ